MLISQEISTAKAFIGETENISEQDRGLTDHRDNVKLICAYLSYRSWHDPGLDCDS